MTDTTNEQRVEGFLAQLRRVNTGRYHAWVGAGQDAGILFDAAELGGEVGELLNVVKKLEREERGWRGSRAAPEDFADECADVLICLDKLARRRGVDLEAATIAKFNATSDKVGLPHRLTTTPAPEQPQEVVERVARALFQRSSRGGKWDNVEERKIRDTLDWDSRAYWRDLAKAARSTPSSREGDLQAENRRLREALEPFTREFDMLEREYGFDRPDDQAQCLMIPLGDIKRLRAALGFKP